METKRQIKGMYEGKNYESVMNVLVDENDKYFLEDGEELICRLNNDPNQYKYVFRFGGHVFYTNLEINMTKLVTTK